MTKIMKLGISLIIIFCVAHEVTLPLLPALGSKGVMFSP